MLTKSFSSIIAAIIKVVVSFEITNAGLNSNVDPDRLFPYFLIMSSAYYILVTVSTILYWSMIEAGLAIIAVCLPTLQFLARKASIDSMLHSLRSAFSLKSMLSQNSRRLAFRLNDTYSNTRAASESESIAPMVEDNSRSKAFVMSDINKASVKGAGIRVTRELSQHDDVV